MNYLLIEQAAFEQLRCRIEKLSAKVVELSRRTDAEHRRWLDTKEVCLALGISKRTLQYFRESGKLPYSFIGSKIFHRQEDVAGLLSANLVKPDNS